nr:immunoglobulin light chain junction region [Macaca mulatta]MOX12485.1 immunoglobulin light chain junction region [Macaca mulatta]
DYYCQTYDSMSTNYIF